MKSKIKIHHRRYIHALVIIIGLTLIGAGCSKSTTQSEVVNRATEKTSQTLAVEICQSTCASQKALGTDLSKGPCLSGAVVEDWVCDVAHNPRQKIDDVADNQCETYRTNQARHFVEVDPDCQLIRAQ